MTSDQLVRLKQLAIILENELNQITTLDLQILGNTKINEIEDTITEPTHSNDIIFLNIDTIRRRSRSEKHKIMLVEENRLPVLVAQRQYQVK